MSDLRLGPLLRFVDETSATVWVETERAARVTVRAGDATGEARTFAVHGHHYALVEVSGLAPGTRTAYVVELDGGQVWPPADSPYPAPVIGTLEAGRPLRMLFGSCRVSVSHDRAGNEQHGVDALRAYALHLAGDTGDGVADDEWPDLVLFLGDQVYADDTSDEMKAFIEQRRDPQQAPWYELQDYEEYAHLYRLAWSEPANRWLLSTLPSAMIFDDHDIRDDWNTSADWRAQMEATDWWHDRVVGGLSSYWVHQHLGNLSPAERAEDALWQRIRSYDGAEELDVTAEVDALADRADQQPDSYRWSFCRDFDTQARLVVVDSRAARVLTPDRRSMLDDAEMAWLDERMRGDVDHLLVGTSLPFLLAPALHHAEAFGEALTQGRLGRVFKPFGEWARQAADLEHWAAFQDGFQKVGRMVVEVAAGERGRPPGTVTFLSGDVHHSYVALAEPDPASGRTAHSAIVQAVCSPIRNPLPRAMQLATALAAYGTARPTGRLLGGRVPRSPLRWRLPRGPWYDNNLAVLELRDQGLHLAWSRGADRGEADRPVLEQVAAVDVPARG
ncbi:alkaline phosphatase D family protein [Nocardioides deserti]|uniref:Alkaline phosphatase D family protein n=1 Tax=Nocardioides deserti TaxID=1588644 RepID=A0ABR6U4D6_9ACTN|nr:alkaline phosphatase D family protein [Nocardioides deserti]MBC2959295.1 alkaline phosphatase D family protein [Nocardioides deserti]GGO68123.1 metallophosphatase [Nocardioides deserti]